MTDKEEEQESLSPHETPAFKSAEVEPALKSLKSLVSKLSKKPAPKKEKPIKADNSTEGASGDGDAATPAEGEGSGDATSKGAEEGEEANEADPSSGNDEL